jgi:ribosomal protein S12 methylthiotransferase accessory factor
MGDNITLSRFSLILAYFSEFRHGNQSQLPDKLRLEAKFDDFTVIDQPIRYKGDGSAPGPSITSWRPRPCARRTS